MAWPLTLRPQEGTCGGCLCGAQQTKVPSCFLFPVSLLGRRRGLMRFHMGAPITGCICRSQAGCLRPEEGQCECAWKSGHWVSDSLPIQERKDPPTTTLIGGTVYLPTCHVFAKTKILKEMSGTRPCGPPILSVTWWLGGVGGWAAASQP